MKRCLNLTISAWILCLSLCGFPESLFAQNGATLDGAHAELASEDGFLRYLVTLEQGELGALELERQRLLGLSAGTDPATLLALARALWHRGQPRAAFQLYQELLLRQPPGEERQRTELELAARWLEVGQPENARASLARLELFAARGPDRELAARLSCLAQVVDLDQRAARACIQELGLARGLSAGEQKQLEQAYKRLGPPGRGEVWVALALSALLPGAGQCLGGDCLDGLNAALVNGMWIVASVAMLREGLILEGVLLGLGLGSRFYGQNLRAAQARVRLRALERRHLARQEILELLRRAARAAG